MLNLRNLLRPKKNNRKKQLPSSLKRQNLLKKKYKLKSQSNLKNRWFLKHG